MALDAMSFEGNPGFRINEGIHLEHYGAVYTPEWYNSRHSVKHLY